MSSRSLVRYRTNDYSAPVAYGHRDVLVRGYVGQVVISCGAEVIAGTLADLRLRATPLLEHGGPTSRPLQLTRTPPPAGARIGNSQPEQQVHHAVQDALRLGAASMP